MTHCHDLFWFHENNHDGIQNREQCSLKFNKRSRGNNSESMQARIVIPVCNISSGYVLHNCKVSC